MPGKEYIISDNKLLIKTVSRSVTDMLRQEIVDGVYPAGEHITINRLVQKYGVSEMPVREAFQCLRGEGLLELHQYKGARVLSLNAEEVEYIYDIRMALEILILKDVIKKEYPGAFIKTLEEINNSIDLSLPEAELSSQYAGVNNQFHIFLFTLSNNKRAIDSFVMYSNLFKALKKRYPDSAANIKLGLQEHGLIIQAVRDRDGNTISELINRHSERAKNSLLGNMIHESDIILKNKE